MSKIKLITTAFLLMVLTYHAVIAQNPRARIAYNFEAPLEYGYEVIDGAASNTKASHLVNNNNHLSITNGPAAYGKALECGLSNNYLTVKDHALSTVGDITTTNGLSISLWVKMSGSNSNLFGRVCGLGSTIDAFVSGSNLTIRFGPHEIRNNNANPVFDETWHHVVVSLDYTKDIDNHHLYIDGNLNVSKSSNVSESFLVNNKPFVIGARGSTSHAYQGAVDELAMFTEPLSQANVTDLYQNGILQFCNQPPKIQLANFHQISMKQSSIDLEAVVKDDGLPQLESVSYHWRQIGGAAVEIPNATSKVTTLSFNQAGDYVFQFEANDGEFISSKNVTVQVMENMAPVVNAGPGIQLYHPNSTGNIAGVVQDDDPIQQLNYQWKVLYDNTDITISNPDQLTSSFTCLKPGTYTLQLTVEDAEFSSEDTVIVQCIGSEYMNGQPIINAGSSRITWLPDASINLNASVSNYNGTLAYEWRKALGPGNVIFSDPTNVTTNATFDEKGTYVLEIVVNGQFRNTMTVEVYHQTETFGYSQSEREAYFEDDLDIKYDFEGFDRERFKVPPPVGTHPRILFNKDELPDLRERLGIIQGGNTTQFGQNIYARITSRLNSELNNTSVTTGRLYNDLKTGSAASFDAATHGERDKTVALMVYEAFRCLLEQDQVAGPMIAQAFSTLAVHTQQEIDQAMPTTNYRVDIQDKIFRQYLGLAYDYLADPEVGFFDDVQRNTMRKLLSDATTNMWSIGMNALPVYGANTSNWVGTHYMHLLFNTLAIEGETGYDPYLYPRIVASIERCMSLAVYEDGATFEGLGKNSLVAETLIPLAKRGNYIGASRQVKNHARKLYLNTMIPTGNQFTFDERLGGIQQSRYVDIPAIKFMYPTDPVIE